MKYIIFWYKMRSLGQTVKETPPSLTQKGNPRPSDCLHLSPCHTCPCHHRRMLAGICSEGKPQTFRLPASLSLSYLSLSSQAYASRYLLGCQDIVKVGLSTPISATFSVVPTCPISILISSLADARRTPS